jgi:formylmethanofuran dehydrogenase subunit E-like metal-binding protein
VTLPALTGLTLNVPELCVIADPLSVTPRFGFEAFDAIATLPLKLPADCGVKVTLKDALCPGVKVTFVPNPEMLNPLPLTEACEIVAFEPPVFCTVSVCV